MFGISSNPAKENLIKSVCQDMLRTLSKKEIALLLEYAQSNRTQRSQILSSYGYLTVEAQLLQWFASFDQDEIKMYANYLKP